MVKTKHVWMVRAGNRNELANDVERLSRVAIGWEETGDLQHLESREAVKARYAEVYPEHSRDRRNVNAGQIHRFANAIRVGDYVLTAIQATREILIGTVDSDYEHDPTLMPGYPHTRRVRWLQRVSRDSFSRSARNTLGSTLTIFQADDYLDEIERLARGDLLVSEDVEEDETSPPFYDEVRGKADELIADLISRLDPFDFQDLVGGVLRAMDFQASSSTPGPDRGVDIIAYPDAFGFQQPRIKAQVKHRSAPASGPDVRNLVATLRPGESGLFVSTGGFTNDAIREVERATHPVATLDRDQFIALLIEYYDKLEPEFKARVPLRRVFIPMGL